MTEATPSLNRHSQSEHASSDAYRVGLGYLADMKTTVTDRPFTLDDAEAYRVGFEAGFNYGQQS